MGKGQYRDRDRGKRRRGFDDDMFVPQDFHDVRPSRPFSPPSFEAPAAQGPVLDATVKMFNTEKGFGFVELSDGSGDAFMHINVLQAAGHEAPAPGSTVRVQVGQGPKGPQVVSVLEVDTSTARSFQPRGPRPGGPRPGRPDPSTAVEMNGTVKWFNADKGFGFIQAEDGGKDVFLHISVLENAGLRTLAEGSPVSVRVVESQKGREAVSVAVTA